MTHSRIRSSHVFGAAVLSVAAFSGLACARQPAAGAAPFSPVAAAPASTGALPVAVNCGPGQQALIRPGVVNGQAISQVDCVAVAPTAAMAMAPAAAPAPMPAGYPVAYQQPVVSDMETMRPVYRQDARPAAYRTAQYEPERRVARSGRDWKKSALIIGSSAGIGAGVGAAVGGKKGALIGAAVGGGGATIWDQVTRRK